MQHLRNYRCNGQAGLPELQLNHKTILQSFSLPFGECVGAWLPHFYHWSGGRGELLKQKVLDVQISIKMMLWNEVINAGFESIVRCIWQRDDVLVLPWKNRITLDHD